MDASAIPSNSDGPCTNSTSTSPQARRLMNKRSWTGLLCLLEEWAQFTVPTDGGQFAWTKRNGLEVTLSETLNWVS